MPDINLSSLAQIRTKVRYLTGSLSENQLTTQRIDDNVNTFILYDFPQHLRLFSFKKRLTFYAIPYIDTYENNTVNVNDPLYNFINTVDSVHGPVYINGNQVTFTENNENFYGMYPNRLNTELIGTGNGVTVGPYTGTLTNIPILQGNVCITSVSTANGPIIITDVPNYAGGLMTTTGNLYEYNNPAVLLGMINYVTGVYTVTLPIAAALDQDINFQAVPYAATKPSSILFYDNKFILRPVPDVPYRVDVEVYMRPTELLTANSLPRLSGWWQYIAYGAAKKIMEDLADEEGVNRIMPEFKKQETLVQRSTLMQMTNESSSTLVSTGYNPYDFDYTP